jgi:hypothetical protein
MVLNHYFTLVDRSFPQKQDLLKQGFKLFGPRSHIGQGTSAEFVLFPKSYFEYIWIDDLEASKSNLLKLYRRDQDSACKYGLCFTGVLPAEQSKDFILYCPPYSPNNKLMVLEESIDDLSMPLIFIDANSNDPKDAEPQNNRKIPTEMLNPQHRFFTPEDINSFKIPEYFRGLIFTPS